MRAAGSHQDDQHRSMSVARLTSATATWQPQAVAIRPGSTSDPEAFISGSAGACGTTPPAAGAYYQTLDRGVPLRASLFSPIDRYNRAAAPVAAHETPADVGISDRSADVPRGDGRADRWCCLRSCVAIAKARVPDQHRLRRVWLGPRHQHRSGAEAQLGRSLEDCVISPGTGPVGVVEARRLELFTRWHRPVAAVRARHPAR